VGDRALVPPPVAHRHRSLWVLFAVWALFVLMFFTVSPFQARSRRSAAFPALALLVARCGTIRWWPSHARSGPERS